MFKIFDKFILMVISGSFILIGLAIIILNILTKTSSLTIFAVILLSLGVVISILRLCIYNKKRIEKE